MENTMNNDPFILGGVTLASRLFIGTGKYGADSLIPAVAEASGAEVITVAMRRVGKQQDTQGIMGHIPAHMRLLPNTSGARTAEEAVRLARLARAAEAGANAKTAFLATMSHEIRTPMNGILGMAQLLLIPGLQDGERLEYAQTILNSGRTLLDLLNDILDLSKVEAGKFELELSPTAPARIVADVCQLFGEVAAGKGLRLSSRCAFPVERYLGDPTRLRQMLANLVGNAIKFTDAGSVIIEARELACGERGAVLEFAVTDTGIGIPPESLPALFQPFSQADSSTTRRYGGTGLGLSIVNSLARLMDGEVGVDSRPGEGSRFWFRILGQRVADAPATGEAAEQPAALPRLNGRVLVVEDNATNRHVIAAMLGKLGLSVELAENGQEGVDRATSGSPPDLVLMDVQMPVMDGLTAASLIRQREMAQGLPRRPIIALTANALTGDREMCLQAGMDDYVPKPVTIGSLSTAMLRWLPASRIVAGEGESEQPPGHTPQPAPALPAVPTFDFRDLRTSLGKAADSVIPNIVNSYLREGKAHVAVLATIGEDFDLERITRIVHNLKSSSAALGLKDFAERCKAAETAARAAQKDKVRELAPGIVAGFEVVRQAAEDMLAELTQGGGR